MLGEFRASRIWPPTRRCSTMPRDRDVPPFDCTAGIPPPFQLAGINRWTASRTASPLSVGRRAVKPFGTNTNSPMRSPRRSRRLVRCGRRTGKFTCASRSRCGPWESMRSSLFLRPFGRLSVRPPVLRDPSAARSSYVAVNSWGRRRCGEATPSSSTARFSSTARSPRLATRKRRSRRFSGVPSASAKSLTPSSKPGMKPRIGRPTLRR